jgi:coenzyme F420-reducing hydrogenase delta subunit/Pyruvate/2-oxoacid:ferredoxin oxidoreductase delta subunit
MSSALDIARRPLAAADVLLNRLYGWRGNPLHQSGALVLLAFVVMFVTGLYLLLFYRIGGPFESIVRIDGQVFTGRWIRALHRYAADLAVVAGVIHGFRILVQGRTWGPRALAWITGVVLFFLMFACGWTGYVMVWDAHGQLLAEEGARLLDVLPIFAEPIGRTFVGDRPIPSAFFFLNLFAHIAVPIGMALGLWLHISKIARPVLLPPRGLLWGTLALLFVASVVAPAPLGPAAALDRIPGTIPVDWLYSFWLPASRMIPPATSWVVFTLAAVIVLGVPWWTRPRSEARPPVSFVDPHLCTGCEQCAIDCPFDAIAMEPATTNAVGLAAHINAARCVSCGICAASCAPMAVGPPGRTGRDQLAAARAFAGERLPESGDVVLVACEKGAGRLAGRAEIDGAPVFAVSCGGNLHTSVVEALLRGGATGVVVAACPPRDCTSREGVVWLEERLFAGREAELQERVDRRRVSLVYAGEAEPGRVRAALDSLRAEVEELGREPSGSQDAEPDGATTSSGEAAS